MATCSKKKLNEDLQESYRPFIWVLKVEILNKSNENHQETSRDPALQRVFKVEVLSIIFFKN